MEEFRANTGLINKQLADRSHAFTSFDPETRARQEIDGFAAEVQGVYEEVSRYANTGAQKAFLAEEMQRFQTGYAAKYKAHLAAKGRCFSAMITGGSNFNDHAHDKANRSEDNRYQEVREFKERATAAIIRELKKMAVLEAGGEVEVMKQKIADAEATQEEMKQANKRMKGSYPGFVLSNNSANIKRMKERLAELQTKEATPTSDIKFGGGVIQDSQEYDRVRIFFDEKPAQEMITKLKGNGWRWAPAMHAWQRKRTAQALYDAKRVTGAV